MKARSFNHILHFKRKCTAVGGKSVHPFILDFPQRDVLLATDHVFSFFAGMAHSRFCRNKSPPGLKLDSRDSSVCCHQDKQQVLDQFSLRPICGTD